MQTPNQAQDKSKLDSFRFVAKLIDDYDAPLGYVVVYSYMLCKYSWFKSQGKFYYESQEKIAEGARLSAMTVKKAVKWLSANNFIEVSKKKGALYYNDQYVVEDKYGIYSKIQNKPTQKKLFIEELADDDQVPF